MESLLSSKSKLGDLIWLAHRVSPPPSSFGVDSAQPGPGCAFFSATRSGLRFFLVELGLTRPSAADILLGFPRSSDGSEEVFHENVFRQGA